MRDDSYLRERLEHIWQNHFDDVRRPNNIHINFGRRARKRLGSIGSKKNQSSLYHDTHIRINGHFRHGNIPEYVIDATIAHELCHYAHGFGSPLPKICEHPHKGGVVEKELKKRRLYHIGSKDWRWLQQNWKRITH